MAYIDQAQLSNDNDFIQRVAAAAAAEGSFEPDGESPYYWATNNVWLVAAAPGFGDQYASALAAGVDRPGRDPGVISDAQILSAIQPMFEP